MAKLEPVQQAFSVGVVDKNKLHRTDLLRVQLAAEEQTNLIGTVTGAMFLRPGFEYIGTEPGLARIWAFSRGEDAKAVLEFADQTMRVLVNDAYVTRAAVTSTVTSGDFSSATGWTLSGGAVINSATGPEMLRIKATAKGVKAICKQQVSTSSAGTEHALRIVVVGRPVTFRCGSTDGGDDYIAETTLPPGTHSLAFTPSGSYWVRFHAEYTTAYADPAYVDSCQVEGAGVMELTTPWVEADLKLIRISQSLDVLFVAAKGYVQKRIEHRGDTSWSVTDYQTTDGPFGVIKPADINFTAALSSWPNTEPGVVTLTASDAFFSASHVGTVIKFFTEGQRQYTELGAGEIFSETIRVSGVKATNYNDRDWLYSTSGVWVGELTVQRSFDDAENRFKDFRNSDSVATIGFTANVTNVTNDDDDDNAIAWYRIGFKDGDFTSGSAGITMRYDGQDQEFSVRVLSVASSTSARVEIVESSLSGTGVVAGFAGNGKDWVEMDWRQTEPSAVAVFDGRLGWAGRDRLALSISDAFNSFDADQEGDSGPIVRALAAGGSNVAQWMLGLNELIVGTDTNVLFARASELGETLAPGNATIKVVQGSVGCADKSPVQIGDGAMFADRSGEGLRLLLWVGSGYAVREVSRLSTEIFASGIVELAYQETPDPRVWIVTGDGKLICVLYDPGNEVLGFFPCETDGFFESVTVLPGAVQDRVYVSVRRVINGNTVRYTEKMALDSETRPDTLCKVMDAFVIRTAASAVLSNLSHLEGETVVVWTAGAPITEADGSRMEFTVTNGSITLPPAFETNQCVVGVPYRGRYKSGRLGYGVQGYNALLRNKRLVSLGLLMTDFVRAGVQFGPDFTSMDPLRVNKDGITAPAIVLDDVQDEEPFAVDGGFDLDSRVCVEVNSPFPARILAMTMNIEAN